MVTARHFGITENRAVRYHADHAGTQLNYEVISEAVCNVREARPLNRNWKARIEEDFCQQK